MQIVTRRLQGLLINMKKRNWSISAIAVLLALGLFGAGVIVGQRSMFRGARIEVRGVQATLLFNRIVQEGEWKSLLARGCVTEAIGEISNSELADRKLLAGFVDEKLDRDSIAYINNRDPNMLSELDSPAGSYANTWPGCQK